MIDPEVLREMLHERMFLPYTFKLKVFQDTYNDESRMKVGRLCGTEGLWQAKGGGVLPYPLKVLQDTYNDEAQRC
jgi:hypothetical protein